VTTSVPAAPSGLGAPAKTRAVRRPEALALVVFAVVTALAASRHDMWRDELQAWGIARASDSPAALWRNLSYEGHPIGWYLLLWPFAHLTANPWPMQAISWLAGVATAALVLWCAPFRSAVRIALVFSYFLVFEYTVVSRSYSLMPLFTVLVCVLVSAARRRYLAIAAALVALSLLSLHSLLEAGALTAGLMVDEFVRWRRRERATVSAEPYRRMAVALGVVIIGAAVSIARIIPSANAPYGGGGNLPSTDAGGRPFMELGNAFVTVIPPKLHFWGLVFLGEPHRQWLFAGIGVVALLAVSWALLPRPGALVVWLFGALSLSAFFYLRLTGSLRNHGHLAVLAVAALWIAPSMQSWPVPAALSMPKRWAGAALAAVLAIQVVAGGTALAIGSAKPFSGAERTVTFLRSHHLDHLPIVGHPDVTAAPVAILLDRPLFYPQRDGWGTYVIWDPQRHHVDDATVLDDARQLLPGSPGGVVIVLDRQLADPPADVRLLFDSGDVVVPDERLRVYGLDVPAPS